MKNLLYFHRRNVLTLLLFFVFIWSLFSVHWGSHLLHSGGIATLKQMLVAIFNPDLSQDIIKIAIAASWTTLVYAACGMTFAMLIGVVFGILASGVAVDGVYKKTIITSIFRSILGFLRAIHELVWAWLFVAATGLNPFAAIFAIALPYGGILGRIFADILNDVSTKPIDALKAAGASKLQLLLYGYGPLAAPDMISYAFYRFECAIRSSAIMSFVGLGGLGFQIQLSLQDLKYDEVWTFMYFLIAMVIFVDIWSQLLRRRLVAS